MPREACHGSRPSGWTVRLVCACQLLVGIFGRAAVPLLIGAAAGCAVALGVHSSLPIAESGGRSIPGIVPVSAALMIVIGLLAVVGPGRRAIRIHPTEALRVS